MLLLRLILFLVSAAVGGGTTFGASGPGDFLKKPAAWFATEEARLIACHVLSFQADSGGWPKNESTAARLYQGNRQDLHATFDNGATTDELRFLARIYNATRNEDYLKAFNRGLDHILDGQYSNGGWPQSHPPGKGYHRHITFNDNAMVRLMILVREVYQASLFSFVDEPRKERSRRAFERGIDCILKCQIKVKDRLTAWCAQHDEIDFKPRPARTFEPASYSGAESVGIVRLLMSLEAPSPVVMEAVDAAVKWFESAKLTGIRVDLVKDSRGPKGTNKVVVEDPAAPPLWARFYEIETLKPMFTDRDGIPKAELSAIGFERRNGYSWYGTWPQKLIDEEYPAWRKRLANPAGSKK